MQKSRIKFEKIVINFYLLMKYFGFKIFFYFLFERSLSNTVFLNHKKSFLNDQRKFITDRNTDVCDLQYQNQVKFKYIKI